MRSLHEVVLMVHGLLRWGVLAGLATAFVRAVRGARAGRTWSDVDARVLRVAVGLFDLQALLGLVMYFGTSALGVRMLVHAPVAIKSSVLRFFAIEHIVGMLVAASVLHGGIARARRLGDAHTRHRRVALVMGIALALVALSIPWPFFPYARPLLRLG